MNRLKKSFQQARDDKFGFLDKKEVPAEASVTNEIISDAVPASPITGPKKGPGRRKIHSDVTRYNLAIPRDLHSRIVHECDNENISINAYILRAIRDELSRNQ